MCAAHREHDKPLECGRQTHHQIGEVAHDCTEEHTMGLTVCPTAVVAALVEVVWGNLIQWEYYSEWFDRSLQVERREPRGPATVGQTIRQLARCSPSASGTCLSPEASKPIRRSRHWCRSMRRRVPCMPRSAVGPCSLCRLVERRSDGFLLQGQRCSGRKGFSTDWI
jgi:hypothetical protein